MEVCDVRSMADCTSVVAGRRLRSWVVYVLDGARCAQFFIDHSYRHLPGPAPEASKPFQELIGPERRPNY